MKINLWQILGGLLALAGVIGIAYREFGPDAPPPRDERPPASQPTTAPLPLAAGVGPRGVSV